MNAKKAKQLRRQAELQSVGAPLSNYENRVRIKADPEAERKTGKPVKTPRAQRELKNCIRSRYQELKKAN